MTRGSLQVQHRRDMRRSAALPGAGNPHMHAQTRTFACGHPHPHVPRPVTKFALVVQELLTSCALTMCCADQPRRLWLFGGGGGAVAATSASNTEKTCRTAWMWHTAAGQRCS